MTLTRSEKVTQLPFADVCRDAAGVKPQEEEEEEEERKDNSFSGSADCAEGVTDSRMYPPQCALSSQQYTRWIETLVKTKQKNSPKIIHNAVACMPAVCTYEYYIHNCHREIQY